ncbi:MAG: hypothetical protein QM784_37555 [Polyangiaceae bacterium]
MAIFFRGLGNLRVFDSDAQLTEERLLAPNSLACPSRDNPRGPPSAPRGMATPYAARVREELWRRRARRRT